MSVPPSPPRSVDRYLLADLVAAGQGSTLWRATDPALDRPVGIRLIPLRDPRSADLKRAACAAATVADNRIVQVLDVLETGDDLAVVTEWIPGRPWLDTLPDQPDPMDVARTTLEVARALQAAHAAGVAHGRLRPSCVLISDSGDVRLRGLGVDAVLWGVSPVADPLRADLHGVGALLYAGLTRRWPGDPIDVLPPAPVLGHRVLPPSRVTADLPEMLDEVTVRSLLPDQSWHGKTPYADMPSLSAGLARAAERVHRPAVTRNPATAVRRSAGVLVGIVVAVGMGLLGWSMATANGASAPPDAARKVDPVSVFGEDPRPSATASTAPPAGGGETSLAVLTATSYDPYGNRATRPRLARDAIDSTAGVPAAAQTAWRTAIYPQPALSGKRGVGLLLDLGSPRPVSSIVVGLVGNGSTVQVLTAEDDRIVASPRALPAGLTLFARARGAGTQVTLRSSTPVTARYVLLWFKRLPPTTNGFQGGVRTVALSG
ncbi:MAG: hypothetical protein EPO13_05165 [Actinomycetota bacterium]|nr:MAG: hypothetical protein EPO13_05165 [Actinomycetota bacterium]